MGWTISTTLTSTKRLFFESYNIGNKFSHCIGWWVVNLLLVGAKIRVSLRKVMLWNKTWFRLVMCWLKNLNYLLETSVWSKSIHLMEYLNFNIIICVISYLVLKKSSKNLKLSISEICEHDFVRPSINLGVVKVGWKII